MPTRSDCPVLQYQPALSSERCNKRCGSIAFAMCLFDTLQCHQWTSVFHKPEWGYVTVNTSRFLGGNHHHPLRIHTRRRFTERLLPLPEIQLLPVHLSSFNLITIVCCNPPVIDVDNRWRQQTFYELRNTSRYVNNILSKPVIFLIIDVTSREAVEVSSISLIFFRWQRIHAERLANASDFVVLLASGSNHTERRVVYWFNSNALTIVHGVVAHWLA